MGKKLHFSASLFVYSYAYDAHVDQSCSTCMYIKVLLKKSYEVLKEV